MPGQSGPANLDGMINRRFIVAGILLGLLAAIGCNPAIHHVRGEVVSVRPAGEETQVCLRKVTDAGSSYGNKDDQDSECLSGIIEGEPPKPGECVALRLQGESSNLRVRPSDECRPGGP